MNQTYLVAGTELSERICAMGISMNLVTYLVGEMHLSSAKSATIVTNFMGTLNLLGLLGGFLADAKLGRYLTVAIFASITALVGSDSSHDLLCPSKGLSKHHQQDWPAQYTHEGCDITDPCYDLKTFLQNYQIHIMICSGTSSFILIYLS